jgi:hypothetical protein
VSTFGRLRYRPYGPFVAASPPRPHWQPPPAQHTNTTVTGRPGASCGTKPCSFAWHVLHRCATTSAVAHSLGMPCVQSWVAGSRPQPSQMSEVLSRTTGSTSNGRRPGVKHSGNMLASIHLSVSLRVSEREYYTPTVPIITLETPTKIQKTLCVKVGKVIVRVGVCHVPRC